MTDEKSPETCDELKQAVAATGEQDQARQQVLIRKSIELGCVEHIPDNWSVSIDDGTNES